MYYVYAAFEFLYIYIQTNMDTHKLYIWHVGCIVCYLVLSNIFVTSKQMELLKWPNRIILLSVSLLKLDTLKYQYITWSTNIYEFLDIFLHLSCFYILANVTTNFMQQPYLPVPISHILSQ